MSSPHTHPKTRETPKAAEAFAAYVAMGPGRSLRKLADQLVSQNIYKSSTTAMLALKRWSVTHEWQARLRDAATARSTRMLEESVELDAESFLFTSRQINERFHVSCPVRSDELLKLRESVRTPTQKNGPSVDVGVNISLTVQQEVVLQRVAERRGLSVDDLLARSNSLVTEDC